MDIFNLQNKILNDEARRKGFSNWDSMKICIGESQAIFLESLVRRTLIEAKESMGQQGQQVLSRY